MNSGTRPDKPLRSLQRSPKSMKVQASRKHNTLVVLNLFHPRREISLLQAGAVRRFRSRCTSISLVFGVFAGFGYVLRLLFLILLPISDSNTARARFWTHLLPSPNRTEAIEEADILKQIRVQPQPRRYREDSGAE